MKKRVMLAVFLLLLIAGALILSAIISPAGNASPTTMADLGLLLLDDESGVSVLAVRDQSPAERAGILPGDILVTASGAAVRTVDQLDELLRSTTAQHIQLQIFRNENTTLPIQLALQ